LNDQNRITNQSVEKKTGKTSYMNNKIELFVDAIIFQKKQRGGIARVYREILPRICEMEPSLRITLFTDGPLMQPLPVHPHIQIRSAPPVRRSPHAMGSLKTLLYPVRRTGSRLWNLMRSAWIGHGRGQIWHSTFYTLPAAWEGKQVVTVHDMILERFPDLYNSPLDRVAMDQKRRCISQADAILCNSETTRQELIAFHHPISPGIYVTPLACSDKFTRLPVSDAELGFSCIRPYLLYIGNRVHYKNFSMLLDTFQAWKYRSQYDLAVVGAPWEVPELKILEKYGLLDHVHLLTSVDDQQLCKLYNRAATLVYPSLYEGFGITLLEAMACGCPIVASKIPSTIEVAGDYPTYFDLSLAGSLEQALEIELERGRDPERQKWGFEQVKQFTWEQTARKTLDVYRTLYPTH
jgi:glycosyltransferase involved in cell wall biosynthesis